MTPDYGHLRSIKTFKQLVAYLRDELDWPIESENFDDLTFEYSAEELGLDDALAVKIKEIKQLRPLVSKQPWGIFFVAFEPKRLPVVALRRILSTLVLKKRHSANKAKQAAWNMNDLLFVSAYGEAEHREITFAHFSEEKEFGDLPTLRVLGWDDENTVLHLEHTHKVLKENLRWPDDQTSVDKWRERWASAFTLRHREVITTSKALAERLAELARAIRRRANAVLRIESDKGPLRKLHTAFKEALIHDLTEDDFADMYAQTISYGLLTARVSRPAGLVADNVADMVPVTNPFLKELLETFLTVGGRKGKIDFDELGITEVVDLLRDPKTDMEAILRDFGDRNPQEDPVIHFYELFLKEYDAKKRMQRGVFYTPRPVVSFIVRGVDEILRKEFDLEDGLADTTTWNEMLTRHKDLRPPKGLDLRQPFVQILDPATGTGTFLVEVIEVVYSTMRNKWAAQGHMELEFPSLWNEYVPKHLLPRLHGFELMMAPYAIAHMKIGLKLYATGYRFRSDERARVYLTNSLDRPHDFSDRLAFYAPALAHEAEAVNDVKTQKHFTAVIGNPPYSLLSANMEPAHRSLVEEYKYVNGQKLQERGALQMEKILNDDYVKFIAYAESAIRQSDSGVLGLITNHSYLDNPVMRGMRDHLMQTFNARHLLNLGGSAKKVLDVTDENVFDIQQGVCISILRRTPRGKPITSYGRVTGHREDKYKILATGRVSLSSETVDPEPDLFLFVPTDRALSHEYSAMVPLLDVMPLHSIGLFTSKDHFVISHNVQAICGNVQKFRDSRLADRELCESLEINPKGAWNVQRSRRQLRQFSDSDIRKAIQPFVHRPFDRKYLFYDRSLVWSMALPVNKNMVAGNNLALITSRQLATPPWNHAFCSNTIVEMFLISNRTKEGNHVFPLYLQSDNSGLQGVLGTPFRATNFGPDFVDRLSAALGLTQEKRGVVPGEISPEDIFNYIYAVFHSPTFRRRYIEFLKSDFPRLPLPSSLTLFRSLAQLGSNLISYHLLRSTAQTDQKPTYVGRERPTVEKIGFENRMVWLDAGQTCGFRGISEDTWNFVIGAYQVCEKWLKDRRGTRLSKEEIDHYCDLVAAVSATGRAMAAIDEAVNEHGGWPAAFLTTKAGAQKAGK